MNRIIFHVDLDAFFASCEERENPQFRGKPIVVGADPKEGKGRGVVSTANYIARKFGIHSALPISYAWWLCPGAIFLPVNGALYSRVSSAVMEILQTAARKYTGAFEQTSIDEAYLDLTNLKDFDNVKTLAVAIKQKILSLENVTASIGVGPNMLVAKIASDFQKPDGLTIVTQETTQAFLDPLPVRKLPGVGPKTETILKQLRIERIADLRGVPQSLLIEHFCKHGISLYEAARGIDEKPLAEDSEAKSISEEHTFEHDTNSAQEILPVLFQLARNVLHSATEEGFHAFRTITVKIRYADFRTHTKSQSASFRAKETEAIEKLALKLFWPFVNKNQKIRLIGFRVSNFV